MKQNDRDLKEMEEKFKAELLYNRLHPDNIQKYRFGTEVYYESTSSRDIEDYYL